MSESQQSKSHDPRSRKNVWETRIVPTARACERFFWNLLWFLLLVCVLFSYNPFR
jgi:hypothetical protein